MQKGKGLFLPAEAFPDLVARPKPLGKISLKDFL